MENYFNINGQDITKFVSYKMKGWQFDWGGSLLKSNGGEYKTLGSQIFEFNEIFKRIKRSLTRVLTSILGV